MVLLCHSSWCHSVDGHFLFVIPLNVILLIAILSVIRLSVVLLIVVLLITLLSVIRLSVILSIIPQISHFTQ